jgi:hypothetical protein
MSEHIAVTFADPSNAKYYYADRAAAQGYQRGAYKTKAHIDKGYERCEGCQEAITFDRITNEEIPCPDAPKSGWCVRYVASLTGTLSGVTWAMGAATGRAR